MKDYFSTQAQAYAQFRPDYPESIYDFILEKTPGRKLAWDCGTGNGQAAKVLSRFFEKVEATDISERQLSHAAEAANINYSIQPAEKTDFPDDHFDLVTVAQALHWFHFDQFFPELQRVAKPGATFAFWGYDIVEFVNEDLNKMFLDFYHYRTEKYWSPERRHIDEHYRTIDFPFETFDAPPFFMTFKWHRHEFEGYLNSWSAVQKCIKTDGFNPVDQLIYEMSALWGKSERQLLHFPIFMKIGFNNQ